ncbi:uncharacterized protein KD926_008745 [Aspergillus affinis]|uniref:uncharacterized protein n=1 Tax=Aspergillus affinis TaxID=1070780 RepID=UPI0022FDDA53|nr:uncharacterized protein KD926_008745 [Aspergillus affinis]KAI9045319.1 hypothetical protein KD926_008745 [Aspergillus affinis]
MSPSGSRMIDPMRASTGTVQLSSPYDVPASRHGYPSHPSNVPYTNSYEPRLAREPRLEAQPVSSKTYRDSGHSTKLRTEYAIRPRQRSSTTSVADIHYTPARLDAPVSRTSPVMVSDYRRSPSPLHTQDRYLVPASSPRHHRRHPLSHTDYASDTGRLDPNERAIRARMAHNAYRGYEPNDRSRYPPTGGLRKGEDIDDYDAYSYTNPREQFEKDSAARLRNDRTAYRRDRPLSLTGIDDPQLLPRKEPRALGPPPSQRGFDKLDRDRRSRHSAQSSVGSDVELSRPRRRSRHRAPVSVHQDHDEGYSSYRDDYEEGHRRHRRHRRPDDDRSSRQSYDDHSSRAPSSKELAVLGAGTGLGTAGLASGYADEFDYGLSPRTDRHPREIEEREHRRRSRSRRPSRRRVETDSDAYSSDEDLKKYRREPSARRKPSSETSGSNSDRHSPYLTADHQRRRRSHSRHRTLEASPAHESSPKELPGRQDDPKRPESTSSKEPDAPPKGILKAPKEKFPEEPNPVREGVAPLKDAHKKGIPPGARWTKVDRRLVNPAALEAGQERFEERPDYVIVLRVLSKEEIQAYAVKTQEIRDARYHEYIRERRRRREEDRRRGLKVDDFSSDDEEDDDDSPLAIEGPAEPKPTSRASNTGVEPAKAAA